MEHILPFIQILKTYTQKHALVLRVIVFLFVCGGVYYFFISAPRAGEKNINIVSGSSLMQVSLALKREHVIRSANIFRILVITLGEENSIKAGTYLFDGTNNVIDIAERLAHASYGVPVEKITITEGMDSEEIAELISTKIPSIEKASFEREATLKEGYLFPDTYFIPLSATTSDIVGMFYTNFNRVIAHANVESSATSKDLHEILTMASIIEGEARDNKDKKIVSGILWKRLELGMPLQVDATFVYINGKASSELTQKDLAIDSPYNTYKYKGLPPGPINNPGLESIEAAMFPTESSYLYYLSDDDGVMHYAESFAAHKANKEKYIK